MNHFEISHGLAMGKASDDVIAAEHTQVLQCARASENDCGGILAFVREECGLLFPIVLMFTSFEHACFTDSNSISKLQTPPPLQRKRFKDKSSDYLFIGNSMSSLSLLTLFSKRKVLLTGDFNMLISPPSMIHVMSLPP